MTSPSFLSVAVPLRPLLLSSLAVLAMGCAGKDECPYGQELADDGLCVSTDEGSGDGGGEDVQSRPGGDYPAAAAAGRRVQNVPGRTFLFGGGDGVDVPLVADRVGARQPLA